MNKAINALHERLVFDRRARALADGLREGLPYGADVLDVGCGDGTIDVLVQEGRPDLSLRGIDVLVRPSAHIPVSGFDGKALPVGDKSVDAVMFVSSVAPCTTPTIR